MRKILISVLIVLLIVMACIIIFKGLSIGNFKILSTSQIVDGNEKLKEEIEQTEVLMQTKYKQATATLENEVSNLLAAKEEYLDLASVSTDSELIRANTKETYTVEFLWTRLGRHATAEGINLECALTAANSTTGLRSINFTATGEYTAIIEFVSAIEDDSKLGFRIENFKVVPNGANLKATFTARNISVKEEKTEALKNENETKAGQTAQEQP